MVHLSIFLVVLITSVGFGAETRVELMLSARNLPDEDICCSPPVYPSDAYAQVYYAESDFDSYIHQLDTIVISNSANPDWPESFSFVVQDGSTARLKVDIYDSDSPDSDDYIGFAEFHVKQVQDSFGHLLQLDLSPSDKGQLVVHGKFNGSRTAFDEQFDQVSKVVHIPVVVKPKAKGGPVITKLV